MKARLTLAVFAVHAMVVSVSGQQDERKRLLESLESDRLEAAGSLLAILERDGFAPGRAALQRLQQLDVARLEKIRAAHARVEPDSKRIAPLLESYVARKSGREEHAIEKLEPLLEDALLRNEAADGIGRASLRLCRRGRASGLAGLVAVQKRWPTAAWALGNLALGQRLVGRYEQAAASYRDLLIRTRRAAWVLNDAALLAVARGQRARALEMLLEGVRRDGDPAGSDSCRGNAALLLVQRARPGDFVKAEVLLEASVRRDKTRRRARFWLERLRKGRPLPTGRPAPRAVVPARTDS